MEITAMKILEQLKICPGFVYQIGTSYYFLGKWICKTCTDTDITDCHAMYEMCSSAGETQNADFYFQKLRVYSDFALEVPCNPQKVHEDLSRLLNGISSGSLQSLQNQLQQFQKRL